MMDKEKREMVLRWLAGHKAFFRDLGSIKILDFKKPDSREGRVRFIFEEENYTVYISGDYGELVAWNATNMTFHGFAGFVHDPGYFMEKVLCHNRPFFEWDKDLAKDDLKEKLEPRFEDWMLSIYHEDLDEVIEEILEDFTDQYGIGPHGLDKLSELDDDYLEYANEMGKKATIFPELYLMAYELAVKQLEEQHGSEQKRRSEKWKSFLKHFHHRLSFSTAVIRRYWKRKL